MVNSKELSLPSLNKAVTREMLCTNFREAALVVGTVDEVIR